MACEAEVVRDLIPRLRGIDVPKLCGDAYRHCFKRGRESTETIQDSIAAEEREAATRVREYCLSCSATFLCRFLPGFIASFMLYAGTVGHERQGSLFAAQSWCGYFSQEGT